MNTDSALSGGSRRAALGDRLRDAAFEDLSRAANGRPRLPSRGHWHAKLSKGNVIFLRGLLLQKSCVGEWPSSSRGPSWLNGPVRNELQEFQSVLLRLEPSFAQSLVYASEKWGQVSLLGGSCGILKKNDKSGLPILTAWMQPLIYSHSSITSLTSITHPLLHLLNYLFTYSLIHTTFSPIPRQPRNDIRGPQLFGGHQAGAHRTAGGDNPKVLRWK